MHEFKDAAGRTWQIELNVASARRLLDGERHFDIFALTDGDSPPLAKLLASAAEMSGVVVELIRPQLEKLGVTPEQFEASLGGEAVLAMGDAFLGEVVSFFAPWNPVTTQKVIGLIRLPESASPPESAGVESGTVPESSASAPTASPSASS